MAAAVVTVWAVLIDGVCVNVILWDGTNSWAPPKGATCVPFNPAIHAMPIADASDVIDIPKIVADLAALTGAVDSLVLDNLMGL